MRFYLGTHMPSWVPTVRIPWFVSVKRVLERQSPFEGEWIMDSGGFTEISQNGRYGIGEDEYLDCINRLNPALAFCQDWMCEPFILEKTGGTVQEHQSRTTASFLSLRSRCDRVRPVLQGWTASEYVAHVEQYRDAGVNLGQLFGVGTVCSRNGNPLEIRWILQAIKAAAPEIRLHGFGLKIEALADPYVYEALYSADSMAWSSHGRRNKLCEDCPARSCANCLEAALLWRRKLLRRMDHKMKQGLLWEAA